MKPKVLIVATLLLVNMAAGAQPVRLHPDNPHYFQYKGKPLVLITSAEHYGAVLNLDFDFEKYLHTLHSEGMNYTRIFTGAYVEIPGSFGIRNNTLAPATGRFIAPWQRTGEQGLYEGERKFDLDEWDSAYFERLKRFVALAEELDVVVEVTFFSSTYQDSYWKRNPFNPGNNINDLPAELNRKESNTLNNGTLTGFQKKLVEKIVTELNGYGNVIYEIQNEPWSDNPQKVMRTVRTINPNPGQGDWFKWAEMGSDASLEWQREMAAAIVETEKNLPYKHLVAQNYTNFKHSLEKVDPNIDILNFHYAWPEAVRMNYAWNRPVGFDESGFDGNSDSTYLRQAWQFMLAGGAIFNNLDYSFFTGREDGTGVNNAPGGGSTQLRKQLVILKDFIEAFDFINMAPDCNVVHHAPGMEAQAISEPGKQYALVFSGIPQEWVKLNLPKGKYRFEFVSPYNGLTIKRGSFVSRDSGITELQLPEGKGDLTGLKILKQ